MSSSSSSRFGLILLFTVSIGILLLTMAPQFGSALECIQLGGPQSEIPFGTHQCAADEEHCFTIRCQGISRIVSESRGCLATGMPPVVFCNMARRHCGVAVFRCNVCQTDRCNNETRVG